MQVLPGDPVIPEDNVIGTQMVAMAMCARKRIWIVTPYFAPTEPVLRALCAAAG